MRKVLPICCVAGDLSMSFSPFPSLLSPFHRVADEPVVRLLVLLTFPFLKHVAVLRLSLSPQEHDILPASFHHLPEPELLSLGGFPLCSASVLISFADPFPIYMITPFVVFELPFGSFRPLQPGDRDVKTKPFFLQFGLPGSGAPRFITQKPMVLLLRLNATAVPALDRTYACRRFSLPSWGQDDPTVSGLHSYPSFLTSQS